MDVARPTEDAIDRDTLIPFVERLLERARALGSGDLVVRRFRLADLEIEVRASDVRLGAVYEGRLGVRPSKPSRPPIAPPI